MLLHAGGGAGAGIVSIWRGDRSGLTRTLQTQPFSGRLAPFSPLFLYYCH